MSVTIRIDIIVEIGLVKIVSKAYAVISLIGFVKIVSKLMLLFLIHLLRFLLCVAQSKDCAK